MRKILVLILLCTAPAAFAYDDIAALCKAVRSAQPGDTLVLKNGIYKDAALVLSGKGTAAKPIVVRAETPGGVRLTGGSYLRIGGTGIEVRGFYFTGGHAPKGAVWEFRNGDEAAFHCRITQCAIDNYNPPARDTENSWVLLYGQYNRFDHNSISGKTNMGVTLAVILDEKNSPNGHRIDNNYFGRRPNLGSNGGETIRVGTSQTSLLSSKTSIEENFFEHCDGEVEIVSIKSCDNYILNNTFYESSGVLALRHGHRNLVEGNIFIGNRKPNTGGLRVINEGHIIRNNSFYGLTGNRFFAALAIMNAVPNSLPNRYHQVRDVQITGNKWIDCDHIEIGVGKDNERTLPPANVLISGNLFYNKASNTVFTALDRIDSIRFINNTVVTKNGSFTHAGFREIKSPKPGMPKIRGRDHYGASWYEVKNELPRTPSGRVLPVQAGQNTLHAAMAASQPGDVIRLSAGTYLLDQPLVIDKYILIKGESNAKPLIRYNGTRSRAPMIQVVDGGMPVVEGLLFDGEPFEGRAMAAAAIAPAPVMQGGYSAWVRDCSFANFSESSFSPFRAQKNTFADTLVFENCFFRDMSGDAIYLSAEKEDAGRYSADHVEVRNCAFYNVLGYAVDLYRGGSDESTSGPSIIVDHCVLENVNNKERGSGIRLNGVQKVVVTNTIFSNSGRGGAALRFDEASWDQIRVSHCSLYNSGRIESFWGKVVKGPVYRVKPAYRNAAQYDFSLHAASPLKGKGSDGTSIGLSHSITTK